MSAEHFETVLTADARTTPDGRGVEWAEAFTGEPRWRLPDGTINRPKDGTRTWAAVKVHAHDAILIAARVVASTPTDGVSGDLPAERAQAARVVEAAGMLVRCLALDAAHDAAWTRERWLQLLAAVRDAASQEGAVDA